ncbi:hypothetical protein GF380_00740, partial [Candidatus Uhrbacteria bacterium]|nr:hypothetical protein [Candidatus Uhrbacteria bacterium]
ITGEGNYLYGSGAHLNDFTVIDISDPANPVYATTVEGILDDAKSLSARGTNLYTLNDDDGVLNVFDVSSSTYPVLVGSLDIGTTGNAMILYGNYALASSFPYATVHAVDISSSTNPTLVSSLEYDSNVGGMDATEMVVYDHYLYLFTNTFGLNIIDIQNPRQMVELSNPGRSTPTFGDGIENARIQGDYMYTISGDDNLLCVWSLKDPANPEVIYCVSEDANLSMDVEGNFLVTTGVNGPLVVYDISDPENIVEIESDSGSPYKRAIIMRDNYLYAGGSTGNFHAYRLSGIQTDSVSAGAIDVTDLTVQGNGLFEHDVVTNGNLSIRGSSFIHGTTTHYAPTYIYASGTGATALRAVTHGCDGATELLAAFATNTDSFTDNAVEIRCSGQIYADNGTIGSPADYAEYFYASTNTLSLGDVVAIDENEALTVTYGDTHLRSQTLGIVSAGGVVTGNGDLEGHASSVIVGLVGQLDVRVDTASSSAINVGDKLMMGASGTAVLAEGPGMILGTALESIGAGTSGTVMAYVSPHWWAGDLLGIHADGSAVLMNDLAVASSTIASASTTLVSSPYFSFQASAYDSVSSTVIESTFHLANIVATTSATTTQSLFTLMSDATSTALLTVSEIGDVAFAGKLYPSNMGQLQYDKYIFFEDSLGGYMRTNAAGWGTGSYDFAEMFPSDDELEPGDIVVIDPTKPEYVKKSTSMG